MTVATNLKLNQRVPLDSQSSIRHAVNCMGIYMALGEIGTSLFSPFNVFSFVNLD